MKDKFTVVVAIKDDTGKIISRKEKQISVELLKLKRERVFQLEHMIGNILPDVVKETCEAYDTYEKNHHNT